MHRNVGLWKKWGIRQEVTSFADLEELCQVHAAENTEGEVKEDTIVIVHPYSFRQFDRARLGMGINDVDPLSRRYRAQVRSFRRTRDRKNRQSRRVIKNIARIAERKKEGYALVLFETFGTYPLQSYRLVERGLVDRVVFTERVGGGHPHTADALNGFGNIRNVYVAGMNGDECIPQAEKSIRQRSPSSTIHRVRDAIMYGSRLGALWYKTVTYVRSVKTKDIIHPKPKVIS